jgi:hypothetical protein
MCEQAFSCLTSNTSKDKNCLISAGDELWVCSTQKLSIFAANNKRCFHTKEVNVILYLV